MCEEPKIKGKPIDHSVTVVGYGTDPEGHGDYWVRCDAMRLPLTASNILCLYAHTLVHYCMRTLLY